jgi:hypothetical protein
MVHMAFSHLVDPPRPIDGGILFTMDTHDLQRTVCVTDAALRDLVPEAIDAQARLRYVMQNIEPLTRVAKTKASGLQMPELIVLDARDVAVIPPAHGTTR